MTGGVSGGGSLPSMTGGVTMPSIPGDVINVRRTQFFPQARGV